MGLLSKTRAHSPCLTRVRQADCLALTPRLGVDSERTAEIGSFRTVAAARGACAALAAVAWAVEDDEG